MYKVKTYANPKYRSNRNEPITYDFYNELDTFHGFNTFNHCRPFMRNHHLDLEISFTNPSFLSEDRIKIDAEIYGYIKIKMKNTTKLTKARICWITNEDEAFDDRKAIEFEVRPFDTSFFEYVLDFTKNTNYRGIIRQIKIFPVTCDYTDKMFEKDDIGTTISIDYIKFDTEDINDGAVSYDFKYDCNDWTGDGCELFLNRGILEVLCLRKDSSIFSPSNLNLSPKKTRYIRIKMKNSTNSEIASFYYKKTADAENSCYKTKNSVNEICCDLFNAKGETTLSTFFPFHGFTTNEQENVAYVENKRNEFKHWIDFPIYSHDKEFTEYYVDIGTMDGNLDQIGFEIAKGAKGLVEVEYIVLDTINPANQEFSMTNDFEIDCDCIVSKNSEMIKIEITGENPALKSINNLNLDASLFKYLHINMKNQTYSNLAEIYWITSEDTEYDKRKCQKFIINEMDETSEKYTIGLNQNQYWRGFIKQIKIIPAACSMRGVIEISKISICHSGDTSRQNRNVVEGLLDDSSGGFATGWTFDPRGGDVQGLIKRTCQWVGVENSKPYNGYNGCYKLECSSPLLNTSMHKEIPKQVNGIIEWDIMMQIDNPAEDGSQWCLADGCVTAIGFVTKNNCFYTFSGRKIFSINSDQWYIIKVVIDMNKCFYKMWVNNELCFEHEQFDNPVASINSIYISTPAGRKVTIRGANRIYRIGYLFDDFYTNMQDCKPFDYDIEGPSKGILINEGCLDIKYDKGDKIALMKKFHKKARGFIEYEIDFILCNKQEGISFILSEGDLVCAEVKTLNGNLEATVSGGSTEIVWNNYKCNVWYKLIIRANILTGIICYSVNGHDQAIPSKMINNTQTIDQIEIRIDSDSQGSLRIRKIRVGPFVESTVPYIDKISSITGLTGVQAWFSIDNFWQRVNNQYPHSDKDPYLGYYDDLNKEAVDWQVKWLAEYGIDFIMPFFYSKLSSPALNTMVRFEETFLNHSKYKDKVKISVCIGEIFEKATHENIMGNVMPYLIETYFKHQSYLLIDNKPVVFILSWCTMLEHLGSEQSLSELLAKMRIACIDEGFDGLVIIGEKRPGLNGNIDSMEIEKNCGLDSTFAYCNIYTPQSAINYIVDTRKLGLEGIPSIGCGWDNRYWCPPGGYFIHNNTPGQFEECLDQIRDEQLKIDDHSASLAHRMLILDNWSEFGEGHSILPSNLYGFSYLNAIRKALTKSSKLHYDVIPEGSYNAQQINPTRYDDLTGDLTYKAIFPAPWHKY